MRLFLIAALPLVLAVPAQMAIGINKVKIIALAAIAGSVVNLPISCYLTTRLGVSGVIWGTVLTTLFSNLLVPGFYIFRVLEISPRTYLSRTLGPPLAGTVALLVSTGLMRLCLPTASSSHAVGTRAGLLLLHLVVASIAYIGGYLLVPTGRGDLAELFAKVRRR
jgi:O-antigen/teichoic acid export membrane protein